MGTISVQYEPLADSESGCESKTPCANRSRNRTFISIYFLIQTAINIGFVFLLIPRLRGNAQGRCSTSGQILYSPAQEVLHYIPKTFSQSFGKDMTEYQKPPSPAVDKLWEDLYSSGISRISKAQAALLPNRSSAIAGDEGNYQVTLDVFHQLHCLNKIRQVVNLEYYHEKLLAEGNTEADIKEHTIHCIDSIRQSLMCSADISPIVWQWNEVDQWVKVRMDIAHSCRNFDKIQDWARDHHNPRLLDPHVHIEDDLDIPVIW